MNSKKNQFAIVLVIIIICLAASCKKVPDPDCSTTPQKFSANVNPIIQSSCATDSDCHGRGSNKGPGPLLTYDQIKSAASDIRMAVGKRTMPTGSTLSTEQINSIVCWVNNGALNN